MSSNLFILHEMNTKQLNPLQEAFFTKGKKRYVKKGEVILASTQKQTQTFYIQKGYIAVYSGIKRPNERLLAILTHNDIFPFLKSVINDPRSASFIAMEDSVVYVLSKKEFDTLIEDPLIAKSLLRIVASLLSIYIDRVDNLEMTTAYARLISRLLFFGKKFGTKRGTTVVINVPVTHATIANSIAVTRETVTRELIRLEKGGFIEYSNQKITIIDVAKLEEELHSVV